MALTAFAEVKDLEIRWRELSDDEHKRAEVLLSDASNIIREECAQSGVGLPAPDDGSDSAKLMHETLKAITCEMVKRVMLVPVDKPSLKSQQITGGPYSEMLSFANPTGDLYLLKAEKSRLGIRKQSIGTIRPQISRGYRNDW